MVNCVDTYKDSGVEWIGKIPQSWKVAKIKYFIKCYDGKRVPVDSSQRISGDYPYWGAGSITDYINDYLFDEELILLGEDGAPFFDKSRPVAFLVNEKIWVNNHIHVLKPLENVHGKYMVYFLNTVDYGTYINGSILCKLTQSNMNNISFAIPDYPKQQAIADYLDRKCGEIDKIVETEKAVIEKLKEYKQSIITEAVTKGLDKSVTLRDSGIEWIGKIPASWGIGRIKYNYYLKGRIGWQGLKADEFIDEGAYLITGTDFCNGRVNWDTCYHISEERYNEAPEIHVKTDDLLITKDGTVGKVAYIDDKPEKVSLNSHLLIIRPNKNVYKNKFLYWVIQSEVFEKYYQLSQNGTIMASLSQEKISNFSFALPKPDEQQQIAEYLDKKCSEIDKAIADKEKLIEKFTEYKKSLIYECVTGKKEVA